MAHRFESCVIPARIPMCRTFDVAELNVISSFGRANRYRKGRLKQLLPFLPIDPGRKINSAAVLINRHVLNDDRIHIGPGKSDRGEQRAAREPFDRLKPLHFRHFFLIIKIDVPGVKHFGLVLKYLQHIPAFALRQHLAGGCFVINGDQLPGFIPFNLVMWSRQTVIMQLKAAVRLLRLYIFPEAYRPAAQRRQVFNPYVPCSIRLLCSQFLAFLIQPYTDC
ncbi:hypothetical protein D3C74_335030 [compost metagenome]